jgi:hypothetical protein
LVAGGGGCKLSFSLCGKSIIFSVRINLSEPDWDDLSFVSPLIPELDLDPSEWLERFALTERENIEKMQRIKSMDRIGGVPPPPKEREDDCMLLFTKI